LKITHHIVKAWPGVKPEVFTWSVAPWSLVTSCAQLPSIGVTLLMSLMSLTTVLYCWADSVAVATDSPLTTNISKLKLNIVNIRLRI
jgi:hypothetical protein